MVSWNMLAEILLINADQIIDVYLTQGETCPIWNVVWQGNSSKQIFTEFVTANEVDNYVKNTR